MTPGTSGSDSGRKVVTRRCTASSRETLRREVTGWFLEEPPGVDGAPSRYLYVVERLPGGIEVMLKRPAHLNKGFDFTVQVSSFEPLKAKRPYTPSHGDLLEEFARLGCRASGTNALWAAVERVYDCGTLESIGQAGPGNDPDILRFLALLRWLFIEQDITYWNYSGRAMFIAALREKLAELDTSPSPPQALPYQPL